MTINDNLKRFGAYAKALELFDHVVADLTPLMTIPALHRLVSQQFASADSIASNIEEGYGRGSHKEYAQFLIIARGSPKKPVDAMVDSNTGCPPISLPSVSPYVTR